MRGYHVEWKKNNNHFNEKIQRQKQTEHASYELALEKHHNNEPDEIEKEERVNETMLDAVLTSDVPIDKNSSVEENYSNETCDTIILSGGQKITAKEISNTAGKIISFKTCNEKTEKNFKVEKADVLMIKYANGKQDIFTSKKKLREQGISASKQIEVFAIVSLGLSVIGIVILLFLSTLGGGLTSLLALTFGIISVSKMVRNPGRFQGKGLAITGIVLSLIGIILAIIGMVIPISFFQFGSIF